MSKIIKPTSGLIQPVEVLHETNVEDFIKLIEATEEKSDIKDYIASREEIEENNVSKQLLELIEDASDVYCEMYKRSGNNRYVNFEIQFTLTPIKEGRYIGKATCNFIKHEKGKKKTLISKVFGFTTMEEVKKNDWGEILLIQMLAELIGCAHILSNLKEDVKESDVIREKLKKK